MNPFEENTEAFDELEPGIYLEHLSPNELQEISEEPEAVQLVFGSVEPSEGFELQAGVLDDALACYTACAPELGAPELTQQQLMETLQAQGLYTEGCGMSEKDVETCFLRLANTEDTVVYVECEELIGLNELCVCVDSGDVVICYVNAAALEHEALADIPGTNADHFVRVNAVDMNGEEESVYIQDTASPDAQSRQVPLERFLKAWNASNYYTITAHARDKI